MACGAFDSPALLMCSANPNDPPRIDFQYFSDPYDEFILVAGFKLARRIVAQSPLREWVTRELFPGKIVRRFCAERLKDN